MREHEASSADKAGVSYWDSRWAEDHAGQEFAPEQAGLVRHPDRRLAELLTAAFAGLDPTSRVIEIGCADSVVLPWVGRRFGFRVSGIDYSAHGCDRARARLAGTGLQGEIECADAFSPPDGFIERFDAAFSIGLVEHFPDTAGIVRALARLLRTGGGGRILTLIPNMNGAIGLVQRIVAPSVYGVHVPLDVEQLCRGHTDAGLEVIESGWHLPIGFGVVNFHEPGSTGFPLLLRRGIVGGLGRLSRLGWLWEEKIGRLPRSRLLSPYAYCIARRVD